MRRHKAFTLIELLVVIAILALLMAILLPSLQRVRRQAKAVVCQANLGQWGKTLALYLEDNQGWFPCDIGGTSGIWVLRGAFLTGDDPNQPDESLHHFHTQGIACCPMAAKPNRVAGGFGATASFGLLGGEVEGTPGSTFTAWEITTPPPAFRGSYGLNQWVFRGFHDHFTVGYIPHYVDIFSLRGRAKIPTLVDSDRIGGRPREFDPPQPLEFGAGGFGGFCINRHEGHVNSLFLDWSVRKVGLKELWTLEWYAEFNTGGRWTKAGGVKPEDWPEWMRKFKDY
jgi:prepilin-type N-terminal cleavage/methylation domain-containing protein